jgi:hypothetical protein
MAPEEKSRLEKLDSILRSDIVREKISPIISRVCTELTQKPEALMTWEPIPLEVFDRALPIDIQSSWVFVLRTGSDTGAERHPNSHQRMMSIQGSGDMRTEQGGTWRSNFLISDPIAPLEQRWISIPPNVWHRPVIGKEGHWVVVSFHTVSAGELIEERPTVGTAGETKQMKYLEQK